MRVLHVTSWTTEFGGVSSYIREMSSVLTSLGVEVDTMCFNLHKHISTELSIIKRDVHFPYRHIQSMLEEKLINSAYPTIHCLEFFRYAFELGSAYVSIDQYDIIHCHDPIATYTINRILKKPIPIITSFHGSIFRESYLLTKENVPDLTEKQFLCYFDGKYLNALEQLSIEKSHLVLTTSHWMRKELEGDQKLSHKLRTLPSGINVKKYKQKQKESFCGKVRPGKKVIGFVGRLEKIKGLHVLIEAFSHLQSLNLNWVGWIAGEGSLMEQLKKEVRALGMDEQIIFWGHVENIPSFLNKVDIYVQPSLQDNQPLSVMEAQLAGIPVIVSDTTGMAEMVIPELTGYTFSWPEAKELAQLMDYLLRHNSVRYRVGMRAQQSIIKKRSVSRLGKKLKDLYEEIICVHNED